MPEVGEPDRQGEGEDEEQQGEVGEAHPGHSLGHSYLSPHFGSNDWVIKIENIFTVSSVSSL